MTPERINAKSSNYPNSTSKNQHKVPNHIIYYAAKTAGAALMVLGGALTFVGTVYAWPIVTLGVVAAFRSASTEQMHVISKIAAFALMGFSKAFTWAKTMGSVATTGVVLIGGVIALAPLALLYGLPALPGSLMSKGGHNLWKYADNYK